MENYETWPGKPYPLGATWNGKGVNFALFAENATGVELCLYDSTDAAEESHRIKLTERSHQEWHIFLPWVKPGQLYGFRVHGPFDPENGLRFNANKLLIDPYAKAIAGTVNWHDSLFSYKIGNKKEDLSFNPNDSGPFLPKCVVVDSSYNWEGDEHLNIPLHETIIYELHVKGFTYQHPDIPEEIRGTYSALAHPITIDYLKSLGITAVELMPIHHFVADRHLVEKGLTNYWGYNSLGFFAPDVRYAANGVMGEQVTEFKDMVKALHKAGIEVILDVVYNHTAEGNHMGPTLSFRGNDNLSYYRTVAENPRYYMDYTGTGNTLNMMSPGVLRMIMDSLRYWITEMHIDGFRFDLASALARELHEVDRLGAFFDIIHQDPLISQTKLIAEPWDVGEGGYQVGEFPAGWVEWNGKYRDCMRDYWRGEDSVIGEFANRLTGSSDLYMDDWRKPTASVNFITAHDGFTLNDLVSYNEKHNEDNQEGNNDGEDHNRSWNCGVEGPTDDQKIKNLRTRQKRNFLTTLFLSQGVPMLVAGDEFSRTQHGNNNAYCQDNEISWLDWQGKDNELLEYTKNLIRLRKEHPIFCRRRWFQGLPIKGKNVTDIAWFLPEGEEMEDYHWEETYAKSLAVFLYGQGIRSKGSNGEVVKDDSFYLMFNAHHETLPFKLPGERWGKKWIRILDTNQDTLDTEEAVAHPEETIQVAGRSMMMMMNPRKQD
jgi:isoamylase